jgi:hypothetical protein
MSDIRTVYGVGGTSVGQMMIAIGAAMFISFWSFCGGYVMAAYKEHEFSRKATEAGVECTKTARELLEITKKCIGTTEAANITQQ